MNTHIDRKTHLLVEQLVFTVSLSLHLSIPLLPCYLLLSEFLHLSLGGSMIDSIYFSYLSTPSFVPSFHLSCYPFIIPFTSTSIYPSILLAPVFSPSHPPFLSPSSLHHSRHRLISLHLSTDNLPVLCPPRVIPLEG